MLLSKNPLKQSVLSGTFTGTLSKKTGLSMGLADKSCEHFVIYNKKCGAGEEQKWIDLRVTAKKGLPHTKEMSVEQEGAECHFSVMCRRQNKSNRSKNRQLTLYCKFFLRHFNKKLRS